MTEHAIIQGPEQLQHAGDCLSAKTEAHSAAPDTPLGRHNHRGGMMLPASPADACTNAQAAAELDEIADKVEVVPVVVDFEVAVPRSRPA